MRKNKGWRNHSHEHALAARGIKTKENLGKPHGAGNKYEHTCPECDYDGELIAGTNTYTCFHCGNQWDVSDEEVERVEKYRAAQVPVLDHLSSEDFECDDCGYSGDLSIPDNVFSCQHCGNQWPVPPLLPSGDSNVVVMRDGKIHEMSSKGDADKYVKKHGGDIHIYDGGQWVKVG